MSILRNYALILLSLITIFPVSTSCSAWGNVHYHGWNYGPGYYGPGPGYYPGWGGPNVIINVPVAPRTPYIIECEKVEVCDNYTGECWIERRCN